MGSPNWTGTIRPEGRLRHEFQLRAESPGTAVISLGACVGEGPFQTDYPCAGTILEWGSESINVTE